jgi:Rad3-related DNA helicase
MKKDSTPNKIEENNAIAKKEENNLILFSQGRLINFINKNKFNRELLDKYQNQAFDLFLEKKLCLVEGIPGTGKTYLATIISNIFLQNNNSKLLIFTSSNQALSKLVFNILQYRDSIKRIEKGDNKFDIIDENYLNLIKEIKYLERIRMISSLIFKQRTKTDIALKQLTKKISDDFYNKVKSVTKDKIIEEDKT